MKVLLSAYACRPNTGSEPGIGWNWAIHLAEAGCEVYVLTDLEHKSVIDAYLLEKPHPNLHPCYVQVPWVVLSRYGNRLHYLFWQWTCLNFARSLAQRVRFDVAHHVSYGAVQVPTQLWRLGIPTVFGPVGGGSTSPEALIPYLGGSQLAERLRTFSVRLLPKLWWYRSWMRKMSTVIAANRDTQLIAQKVRCRRVELLCDTGIRDDFRSEKPRTFRPASPLRALWVGRFLPRKGLALALDAMAQVGPNIHLTLVGDGIRIEKVKSMISARSLEERVIWAGAKLPWMHVREAYATHDVLLFTSLRDSFGSQNLEAMSLGLPVIALSLSGARDFIPSGAGIKVNVGSTLSQTVRNLSDALETFATLSLDQRNRMSEVAWRGSMEFAWTLRAATVLRLYEEIADNKSGTAF